MALTARSGSGHDDVESLACRSLGESGVRDDERSAARPVSSEQQRRAELEGVGGS
jgi:hypothetical protein